MKRHFIFSLLALTVFTACNEANTNHQQKNKSSSNELYPSAPTLNFDPLNRLGCTSDLLEEEPVGLYLDAVLASNVHVEQAQESLSLFNRQLKCMSAHDFALNYTNLMDYIESNFTHDQTEIAPLIVILTENGAKLIDQRASIWLYEANSYLENEVQSNEVPAKGLGFYYVNGFSVIKMNNSNEISLVKSLRSSTWIKSKCSIKSAVFFESNNYTEDMKYVCLNDSCPNLDEIIPSSVYTNGEFGSYCNDLNGDFDSAKEVGSGFANGSAGSGSSGGSTGGSGPNGGFTESDGVFDDIMNCVNNFNTSNTSSNYICAVQTANRNSATYNSFGSFQSGQTINVGVDFEVRNKGCAPDPVSNDVEVQATLTELEELDKEIEEMKSKIPALDDAIDELQQDMAGGQLTTESKIKILEITGDPSLEPILTEEEVLREAEKFKQHLANLETEYEQKKPAVIPPMGSFDNHGFVCQNDGSGCSENCNITDQLAEQTNECLGLAGDNLEMDLGELPSGNPEVAYPVPGDVDNDDAFSAFSQCLADAMGINTTGNLLEEDDSCGQLILCTNNTTSTVDINSQCSCGASGSDAYGFSYGWGNLYDCEQAILCEQDNSSCGCGSLSGPAQVDTLGGVPLNPEVFYRIPATDFQEVYQ